MDIKFENRFVCTKKMISEYVYKVLYKNMITAGIIECIILALFLVCSVYGGVFHFVYMLSALFFFVLFIVIFSPILAVRQIIYNDKRLHNNKEYDNIVSFGDKIYEREENFSLDIEYYQIIKIYYLKHSCVLMFGKRNAIMIDMNKFTVGTAEEFKNFIAEKCVNLKKIVD